MFCVCNFSAAIQTSSFDPKNLPPHRYGENGIDEHPMTISTLIMLYLSTVLVGSATGERASTENNDTVVNARIAPGGSSADVAYHCPVFDVEVAAAVREVNYNPRSGRARSALSRAYEREKWVAMLIFPETQLAHAAPA